MFIYIMIRTSNCNQPGVWQNLIFQTLYIAYTYIENRTLNRVFCSGNSSMYIFILSFECKIVIS